MKHGFVFFGMITSLPSRGAWIEMRSRTRRTRLPHVAPLAGSVDRNLEPPLPPAAGRVAPLAGSVDRNILRTDDWARPITVAPLAGSVDRNFAALPCMRAGLGRSPRGERG